MVDNEILITGFIGLVSTVVGSWAGYFFTRRKYNSEVDLNLIDKMQKSLDFYIQLSEDNKRILEETRDKMDKLEKRNDILEAENRELRNQVFTFMSQICTDLSCSARQAYKEKKRAKKTDPQIDID